jgi:hypothetical protein
MRDLPIGQTLLGGQPEQPLARGLPLVASDIRTVRRWSVEHRARILAEGPELTGDHLAAFLESVGIGLAELERWRVALEEASAQRDTVCDAQ